ncbi:hypothetical protein L2E82_11841 [Cichorium intybus]|uniref:Uncharacterized protein n=1 Tax=Cichorium intybus TaxID=13427 RepID=A0ACB9GEF8_CICIN|nr:hypothetical protein L2E82_11841 [Cichorium intybus]
MMWLLYCDAVKCEAVKLTRKIPVISMWTTDDLENREMEEIISGGFGLGKVVEDDEGPSTRFNTIEEQTTSIEEYGEKFERLFKIVLDAKNKDDNEDDFGAELDRDVNVLEIGGSGDVELDEERGVQKKYDSFDGGSKLSDEKKLLVQFLLRCSEDDDRREVLFETSSGDVLFRQDFESMRPLSPINRNVIDCWSCILNHQESLTSKSSRRFLYLNSSIMSEDTLNVSTPSKRSYEIFNNRMERFISHVQRSLEFNELKLVFFLIKDEKNLYCLVFNLEKVDYILLDSTNYGAPGMRIYGNIPLLLNQKEIKGLPTYASYTLSDLPCMKSTLIEANFKNMYWNLGKLTLQLETT